MIARALLVFLLCLPAVAQTGPCSEQFVKAQAAKPHPDSVADDVYFFSGALDKPVIGKPAADKAFAPITAERKNETREPLRPERIVAAPSGDMAYEYGTVHDAFDERRTGKHIDFTAAYLRVWRAEGGTCKLAAEIFEPEGEK
ncbi:MAG TPA: nuclear transport factor 2 family protein [Terriglobales bacterium]